MKMIGLVNELKFKVYLQIVIKKIKMTTCVLEHNMILSTIFLVLYFIY